MRRNIRKYLNVPVRRKKAERKVDIRKYLCLLLFICFVGGIVTANFIDKDFFCGFRIFNTYYIEKFKYAKVQAVDLFLYVLKERLPFLLLLFLLAMTKWGTIAGGVFLAWQGYAAGFLMAASVTAYGVKGILLVAAAAFPQYLIYIPLYISYMYLAAFFRKRIVEGGNERAGGAREKIVFGALCLLILSIFCTGVFLESYVNPYLLKKILKIF